MSATDPCPGCGHIADGAVHNRGIVVEHDLAILEHPLASGVPVIVALWIILHHEQTLRLAAFQKLKERPLMSPLSRWRWARAAREKNSQVLSLSPNHPGLANGSVAGHHQPEFIGNGQLVGADEFCARGGKVPDTAIDDRLEIHAHNLASLENPQALRGTAFNCVHGRPANETLTLLSID